jgi:hypothetical protein
MSHPIHKSTLIPTKVTDAILLYSALLSKARLRNQQSTLQLPCTHSPGIRGHDVQLRLGYIETTTTTTRMGWSPPSSCRDVAISPEHRGVVRPRLWQSMAPPLRTPLDGNVRKKKRLGSWEPL